MWVLFPSQVVLSALLGLVAPLVVAGPRGAAATHPGDEVKAAIPPRVLNGGEEVRVQGQGPRPGPEATQDKGTGAESKPSNPKLARTDALVRLLDQEIPTKDLPRSFWDLLDYLTARTGEAGQELPFFVDVRHFSKEVQAVLDGQLPPPRFKLHPLPPRMSVRAILHFAVNQFDGGQATFLIRQGRVELTTREAAALPNLLKQTFAASFDRHPLEFVLDDLSEITGVSVVIDGRAKDRLRTPVTARFRNDVPLLEALHMVTESAGLKLVVLPASPGPARALFVTTPEHARAMQL